MRELATTSLRGKRDLLDDAVPIEGITLELQFQHTDSLILLVLILLSRLSFFLECL